MYKLLNVGLMLLVWFDLQTFLWTDPHNSILLQK